jgi:HNH endonuclease
MRRCGRCGELKPADDFAWRRKEKGQRHNYCRPCHSEYHREHYLANKQRYITQAAEHKRKARIEQTKLLLEYFKQHPCVDCGETDAVVLEFDHIRDKSFAIGTALTSYGWDKIVAEIEKCEVVCANCHRRRTARRRRAVRFQLADE